LLSAADALRLEQRDTLDDEEWRLYANVDGGDSCAGDYYPTDGKEQNIFGLRKNNTEFYKKF
jgi:hypothetical protein